MKKLLALVAVLLLIGNNVELNAMNRVDVSTEAEFNDNITKKPVAVVLISTTWCGPCKKLKPIVEELTKEIPNVMFVHIDGDNPPKNVAFESFPTIKIYKDGKEVEQVVGFQVKEKLRNLIQKHAGTGVTKPAMVTAPTVVKQPTKTKPTKYVSEEEEESYEAPKYKASQGKGQPYSGKSKAYKEESYSSEGEEYSSEDESEGYSSSED